MLQVWRIRAFLPRVSNGFRRIWSRVWNEQVSQLWRAGTFRSRVQRCQERKVLVVSLDWIKYGNILYISVNISSFVMRINQLLTHSNLTNTIYRLLIIVVLIQVTGRKEWVTLD